MDFQTIEANRTGLAPLPISDTLVKLQDGSYIRIRVTSRTSESEVRNEPVPPGDVACVYLKFQCSIAKDDTGDVREDSAGRHLLLPAEVHGVTVDSLIQLNKSFEAWLASKMDDMVQSAVRKKYVLDEIISRYRL